MLFYLAGKKNEWVAHAQKHAAAEDYQQVLTWVSQKKPAYNCDPKGIDNDFGGGSKRALIAFKKGFNKEFGKKLQEDDTRRKDDWAAFYDVYDDVLSTELEIAGNFAVRQKALDERRKKIGFTGHAAIGCGEHFTLEKAGEDAVPSGRNRRVDVLLFDEGEVPPIATDPPGEAIYAMGRFAMVGIGVGTGEIVVITDVRGAEIEAGRAEAKLVLTLSGAGLTWVERVEDQPRGSDPINVVFRDIPRQARYTMIAEVGRTKSKLFSDLPFAAIGALSRGLQTTQVSPLAPNDPNSPTS